MKTHRFHTWARLLTQQSLITVKFAVFRFGRHGHGDMDMGTWTWRHGPGDMDMATWTWRLKNGDMDMET
jgi:hypothetical protein